MTETRPTRILRALAAAPDGLSTPAIVEALAEGIKPNQKALSWYGSILRSQVKQGNAEKAGTVAGHWQKGPAIIWRITGKGRELLAYIEDGPAREAEGRAVQIRLELAAQNRMMALAEAAQMFSQGISLPERRTTAIRLRALGCTLEEIGQVFGVTREMIRLDCLHCEPKPRPERRPDIPGQRPVDAAVVNGLMVVRAGKRTIYFTRTEAMQLAEVIGNWDGEQSSALPA